ncbi:serine/arginine repetitive matrix protein 2-like isoform X2 [Planococcus citri]|uniref:serine/arginine repetitive matrix protein 2-like isoform X2 n=1 Tax=Planococcus citri TaxID=170843 RepID=UPI0031FA4038
MESVDMEISSATEEEDDDDEEELDKLLNSLTGMEKCLVPFDDESDDVAVIEPEKGNEANNNHIAGGNQTRTLMKTKDGSKQCNSIEIRDVNSIIAVSPVGSNASTLSRESTPRRHCQTDCDNGARSPIPQITITQLSDKDSDNDVILDSINERHKNLETGSGSDHSDICFLGVGRATVDDSKISKQTSTLPDNGELNSKSSDSGVMICSPINTATEHNAITPVQTQPQDSEKASPPKDDDSDSDCLIVEHIAASDHRLNGLIDLTKPENEENGLPLENRTEESLLKEISQIREALMKHATKKHKKNKKHKHHKSHSSSKKKKKRAKSRTKSRSPSLEKVSDNEEEIPDEPRVIMLTESGRLSVEISNLRSKWDSSGSDDSSKTTRSKRKKSVDTEATKSNDKETAGTAKTSESTEKEIVNSTATAMCTEMQNGDSSTTQCTEKVNTDSLPDTQPEGVKNADPTQTTESKKKENTASNRSIEPTVTENVSEKNKSKTQESPKVTEPADKAESDDSPLWNSDSENIPDFSQKSNTTGTNFNDNSTPPRPDFNDNSRVTVLTFGINKDSSKNSSSSVDSNPLRRKLSYKPDKNDNAKKPPHKKIFCESGKEMKSNFRRRGTPKSYRGRGSKKESYPPPSDIGSRLFRKSDVSDSEPEKRPPSVPSASKSKSHRGRGSKTVSYPPPSDIGSRLFRKSDVSDSEPEKRQPSAPPASKPKSHRVRGSKKESIAPPSDIGSYLFGKSDGSESELEKRQPIAPSADRFDRFMSDSDSEMPNNSPIRSKSVGRFQDAINWKSVPESNYGRGRSRSTLESPPLYLFPPGHPIPPPAPIIRRSLSRSPSRYHSPILSSYRSPSFTYRSSSRHSSKARSITRESYYRPSLSRSPSPGKRTFRSKSRSHRSKSRALRSPSPSRSHRGGSRPVRSPPRYSRSRSRAYRSPSMSRRSTSRTRRSKSRTYRSPSRSRRSKSRTYRSPSRSRRSKSRTYRSPSRSRSKSHRRRSKSRRNSSASSSNSTRSPSLIRAARACSPLEDMRQQLRKNNEAAVQQALGGLQKSTKGRANLKACKARVIDDLDLTTSSPSPEMCTRIPTEIRNARPQPQPLPQTQPIRMQHPSYMPMTYPMVHNPGMMNQMPLPRISHVFSRATGPPERPLGPPDRPLGPPDRPLGPPDRPLGPPDRPLGPPDRPLGPPDGPLESPGESFGLGPPDGPLGPPDRPLGLSNRTLGPPDRPLGLSNRTLGPPERPLGPPEGPPGPPGRRLASPECYMPLHFYLNPPYINRYDI